MADNHHNAFRYHFGKKGDFELILGSDPDCDIPFEKFQGRISPKHIKLRREGDRLFLRGIRSAKKTCINGKEIGTRRWHEVTLNDEVFLGEKKEAGGKKEAAGVELVIKPTFLFGMERVSLIAHDLYYAIKTTFFKLTDLKGLGEKDVPQELIDRLKDLEEEYADEKAFAEALAQKLSDKAQARKYAPTISEHARAERRILTNHISLKADPGTLIGIMGPSGAGKTVLLNLLSGYTKPQTGRVTVGNFDVHESFGMIKDIIGYVHQEDILIPQLTVEQSLNYAFRLRYPDRKYEVRKKCMEDVLGKMGFAKDKLTKLLKTKIGSSELRGLSGGERRRVNIAHELIRDPLLLFLDEPTSGLSSVDSEYVVGYLKQICEEKQVAMLMTIHQPSEDIFNQLDKLLLVNVGGNIVYFDSPKNVVPHFREHSGESTEGNPADYVLRVLKRESWISDMTPEELHQNYQKESLQSDMEVEVPQEEDKAERKKNAPLKEIRRRIYDPVYQLGLLLGRNIQVKLSDKKNLALLILQAVIISFLLIITFKGFLSDYEGLDRFARTWSEFTGQYDKAIETKTPLVLESAFRKSKEWADEKANQVIWGEHTAQRRAAILFLLIASAIWFGVINASREIVSEKLILKRETRGSLCISSYLTAKICILLMIAIVQTLILLAAICIFLLPVSPMKFLKFWGVLILTSTAASSLGLWVSAMARNEQESLTWVPIIVIFELFMGGLVRPVKFLGDMAEHVSHLAIQKWFFKAMLIFDSDEHPVLFQIGNLDDKDPFNYIRFTEKIIADIFFDPSSASWSHWPWIGLHTVIPLLVAYAWLKRKYP